MEKAFDIESVNDIYPIIGDGIYQARTICVVCLAMIPLAMPQYLMVFLSQTPQWISNATNNISSSLDDICKLNGSQWKFTTPSGYSIVSEFDLYCGKDQLIHTTTMLYFALGAIGSSAMGYLADRFGRKVAIIAGLLLTIAVGCACAFAVNFAMFMVFKAMSGLFAPALYATMVVYASETVSEKKRTAGSLVVWVAYFTGNLLLALTSYLTQNWRKLMLYTSIPYIAIAVMLLFIPETLPWLYQHRKLDNVKQSIAAIARVNKRDHPREINFIALKDSEETAKTQKPNLWQLFSSVKMANKSVALAVIWIGTAMTFIGLSYATDHLTGNIHRDFALMSVFDIFASVASIFLAARFGRKKICMTFLFTSGMCLVMVAVLPHPFRNKGILNTRLVFGIVGKFLTTASYNILATWTAEVYPTFLRSTACGFHQGAGIAGMMVAPWIALWLKKFHASLPFYCLGSATITAAVLMIMIGETNKKKFSEGTEVKIDEPKIDEEKVSQKENLLLPTI